MALKNFFQVAIASLVISGFSSMSLAGDFDVAAKYASSCAVCHNSGVAGAPKKGDANTWKTRLALGEQTLLNSVKKGKGAMPAMGLCPDCSDAQLSALIQYLAQ